MFLSPTKWGYTEYHFVSKVKTFCILISNLSFSWENIFCDSNELQRVKKTSKFYSTKPTWNVINRRHTWHLYTIQNFVKRILHPCNQEYCAYAMFLCKALTQRNPFHVQSLWIDHGNYHCQAQIRSWLSANRRMSDMNDSIRQM